MLATLSPAFLEEHRIPPPAVLQGVTARALAHNLTPGAGRGASAEAYAESDSAYFARALAPRNCAKEQCVKESGATVRASINSQRLRLQEMGEELASKQRHAEDAVAQVAAMRQQRDEALAVGGFTDQWAQQQAEKDVAAQQAAAAEDG